MNKSSKKTSSRNESLVSCYGFTKTEQKKYPIVTNVLKQLTIKRIKNEIKDVQEVKLPPELNEWIGEYKKIGGDRDDFIWKWTYAGMQIHTLSSVPKKYRESIYITKTVSIIIDVLVDDIIDKRKNRKMLEEVFNSCVSLEGRKVGVNNFKFSKEELDYLSLIKKTWNFINKKIKKYPRYKEFGDIFIYDYRQFFNSMRYSYLIHKNPHLINKLEYYLYLPANMQSVISNTFDLMCSVKFNSRELGMTRELIWYLQEMLRIGNWITTWEREIKENDFTSVVFAYAIDSGHLNSDDLINTNESKIIKNIKKSNAEKKLLEEWENCYIKIKEFDKKVKSVDVKKVLSSSEKFLIMHLSSKGYK